MAIPSNSLTGTTASEILNGAGSVATNISGDAGADTITLNNADSYGNGGEGDDSIIFGTSGDVISTFDGLMSGEGGNDYLSFTASDVVASNAASFMGGKGNDTIALGSAGTYTNAVVGGGLGNDSIALESGTWSNVSIKGGDNADTIAISTGTTVSTKTSYFGAKGADSISVLTDDVSTSSSVYAGMGHDTIVIGESAETTYVVGGFGNDSVLLNSGSDTSLTIVGGGMADTINLGSSFEGLIYGDTLTEGSNDGADTIGSTAQALIGASSVYGGGGSDTIAFSCQAEAAVLSGGSAGDRIEVDHVGTAITIDGGNGADTIVLSSHVSAGGSVLGGAGADTINLNSSFGGGLTVDGGAGVDTITFDAVSALTILGGDENDLIKSSAQDLGVVSVDGGAGNDTIELLQMDSAGSIGGGAGNDSIYVGGCAMATLVDATLNGGAGTDTIRLDQATTANSAATTADVNIVYNAGDVIQLTTNILTLTSTEANWQAGVPSVYLASGLTASEYLSGMGSVSVWESGSDTYIGIAASTANSSVNYTIRILGKDLIDTTIVASNNIPTSALGFTVSGSNDGGMTITLT